MEPLTDVEKDRFVRYCDAVVREADEACARWCAIGDKFTAAQFNIEALAHRMVAMRLRSEQLRPSAR